MNDWKKEFEEEIRQAELARNLGNEGKARVCARRAAGIVIGEYFLRENIPTGSSSAYERLEQLKNMGNLSLEIIEVTDHFLIRLTPDHAFPLEADLIAEADWLRQKLIGE